MPLLIGSIIHAFSCANEYDLSMSTLSGLLSTGMEGSSGGLLEQKREIGVRRNGTIAKLLFCFHHVSACLCGIGQHLCPCRSGEWRAHIGKCHW